MSRFGAADLLGAMAATAHQRDLVPGSTHPEVSLDFWAADASDIVHAGDHFVVWYGGDVGDGVVSDGLPPE